MLICPKCKTEYREGYKLCSDCKEELIEISDVPDKDTITKEVGLKRTLIGIALLVTSVMAYIGISISTIIYASQLTQWHTDKGRIGTALTENALLFIPCFITAIMFVFGIVILFSQYYSKTDK